MGIIEIYKIVPNFKSIQCTVPHELNQTTERQSDVLYDHAKIKF